MISHKALKETQSSRPSNQLRTAQHHNTLNKELSICQSFQCLDPCAMMMTITTFAEDSLATEITCKVSPGNSDSRVPLLRHKFFDNEPVVFGREDASTTNNKIQVGGNLHGAVRRRRKKYVLWPHKVNSRLMVHHTSRPVALHTWTHHCLEDDNDNDSDTLT